MNNLNSKHELPRWSIKRLTRPTLLKVVIPLAVILSAVLCTRIMIATSPQAPRKPQVRQATLVDVIELQAGPRAINIQAMGTAAPARQMQLKTQVAGRIEWMDEALIPGGYFPADRPLVRIEQRDYELAVSQRQSEVTMAQGAVLDAQRQLAYAQRDLKLELGSQSVARREYELLESQIDESNRELVLRQPQLEVAQAVLHAAQAGVESAQASLDASEARLEDARLDLRRTTLHSPFNAIIQDKYVDTGDVVNTTTPLVSLIGTDMFWIQLAVPEGLLKWIQFPAGEQNNGSEVTIYNIAWDKDTSRTGYVLRQLPDVDLQGRMAKVLVGIDDPLALAESNASLSPLLVNTFVSATIIGRSFDMVIAVPRDLVRSGDKLWIMNDTGGLEIRRIQIFYRGRDEVFIQSGVEPGEWVVVTDLPSPVEGMQLKVNTK